jgi:hypothetical protein
MIIMFFLFCFCEHVLFSWHNTIHESHPCAARNALTGYALAKSNANPWRRTYVYVSRCIGIDVCLAISVSRIFMIQGKTRNRFCDEAL